MHFVFTPNAEIIHADLLKHARRPVITDAVDGSTGGADQHPSTAPPDAFERMEGGWGGLLTCLTERGSPVFADGEQLRHVNKSISYLENVIGRSSHLLVRLVRDGAGWSRITQCAFLRQKAHGAQRLIAAPRNEHRIKRAHCSCLVHSANTESSEANPTAVCNTGRCFMWEESSIWPRPHRSPVSQFSWVLMPESN